MSHGVAPSETLPFVSVASAITTTNQSTNITQSVLAVLEDAGLQLARNTALGDPFGNSSQVVTVSATGVVLSAARLTGLDLEDSASPFPLANMPEEILAKASPSTGISSTRWSGNPLGPYTPPEGGPPSQTLGDVITLSVSDQEVKNLVRPLLLIMPLSHPTQAAQHEQA